MGFAQRTMGEVGGVTNRIGSESANLPSATEWLVGLAQTPAVTLSRWEYWAHIASFAPIIGLYYSLCTSLSKAGVGLKRIVFFCRPDVLGEPF